MLAADEHNEIGRLATMKAERSVNTIQVLYAESSIARHSVCWVNEYCEVHHRGATAEDMLTIATLIERIRSA